MKISDTRDMLIECDKCGADFLYEQRKTFDYGRKVMCPDCKRTDEINKRISKQTGESGERL